MIVTLKALLDMEKPEEAVLSDLLGRMQSALTAGTERDLSMSEVLARRDEVKDLLAS